MNSSVGANAPGFVMFPLNPRLDWSPATTDVRHLAVINGSYELPWARERDSWRGRRESKGSWPKGGESAPSKPCNPDFPSPRSWDSTHPTTATAAIPSGLRGTRHSRGNVILGGPNQYFNPNAFVLPPAGTYGNVGRNVLTGPGLGGPGFLRAENHGPLRESPPAIPGGILQSAEPREFRQPQRGGVLVSVFHAGNHRGSDHQYRHHLAADPVRAEGAILACLCSWFSTRTTRDPWCCRGVWPCAPASKPVMILPPRQQRQGTRAAPASRFHPRRRFPFRSWRRASPVAGKPHVRG